MKNRKKTLKYIKIAVATAAVIGALFAINGAIRPAITSLMLSQSKLTCTKVLNEAVFKTLEDAQIDYGSFVVLNMSQTGEVVSITTNAASVNHIKTILTDSVNDALASLSELDVRIPLGTLTGTKWLSGRGPKISLRMIPSAYAESRILSDFDESGINQTRHRIVLEFDANLTAIIVPYSVAVNVRSDVSIAETIIVGSVPKMYADFIF